jgi:hypothetical protein
VPGSSDTPLKTKSTTVKITVLDPTKANNAPKLSAKALGSIDAVRDDTSAIAEVTIKNVYDPDAHLDKIECVNITRKVKGKVVEFTDQFYILTNGRDVIIEREGSDNLEPGTYQADLNVTLDKAVASGKKSFPVSFSFKVVRGKTGAAISVLSYLINRDYDSKVTLVTGTKDAEVNSITKVEFAGNTYDGVYVLEETAEDGVYELKFAPGYVEKKSGKPITKAVTKTVPVNVYFDGSDTPDKINVKIVTNP